MSDSPYPEDYPYSERSRSRSPSAAEWEFREIGFEASRRRFFEACGLLDHATQEATSVESRIMSEMLPPRELEGPVNPEILIDHVRRVIDHLVERRRHRRQPLSKRVIGAVNPTFTSGQSRELDALLPEMQRQLEDISLIMHSLPHDLEGAGIVVARAIDICSTIFVCLSAVLQKGLCFS